VIIYFTARQVILAALRPPADAITHKHIIDSGLIERGAQRLAAELRRVAAVRLAARVHEPLDAVPAEQTEKSFDLNVAVADAVQGHGEAELYQTDAPKGDERFIFPEAQHQKYSRPADERPVR